MEVPKLNSNKDLRSLPLLYDKLDARVRSHESIGKLILSIGKLILSIGKLISICKIIPLY